MLINSVVGSFELPQRSGFSLVPVGLGDVDYETIFASAELAGMKHFCVEHDNAAS
jgi:hypothetical protein